jgi:hypothetical protein
MNGKQDLNVIHIEFRDRTAHKLSDGTQTLSQLMTMARMHYLQRTQRKTEARPIIFTTDKKKPATDLRTDFFGIRVTILH